MGGVSKLIAACFALSAFAVAIIAGMMSGNSSTQILLNAVIVLIVCYPIGWMAGLLCQYVVHEHTTRQENAVAAVESATNESNVENSSEGENPQPESSVEK